VPSLPHEHELHGPERVTFGVVVVSDAVYEGRREDVSGRLAKSIISSSGHKLGYFSYIPNDVDAINNVIDESLESGVDVLILIGGTGLGPNDLSVDVVKRRADKDVPGFGEIFRAISYKQIGERAMLSRAGMWIVSKMPVAVTPGSPDAVETALKLIIPVARHLVAEARGLRHGLRA